MSRCQTTRTLGTGLGVSGRSWEPQLPLQTGGVEGRTGTREEKEPVSACQVTGSLCAVAVAN